MRVRFSEVSKRHIKALSLMLDDECVRSWAQTLDEPIQQQHLITWLKQPNRADKSMRLLVESLHTALLDDLYQSLPHLIDKNPHAETESVKWFTKAELHLLVISGSLLALWGGFTGITSVLALFAIPSAWVVAIGLIFSGLSLALFYQFERVEMSKLFGIPPRETHQLLDVCLAQDAQIKALRKKIDDGYITISDTKKLQALHDITEMLLSRYQALHDVRQEYRAKLNNPYLKGVKRATALVEGALVLASGFFAGQSLALLVVGFFITSVSVTFWPIPLMSVIFSLAALGVYYVMERPGFENRVGRLLGLDKNKIERLVDATTISHNERKLEQLKHRISERETLHQTSSRSFFGIPKITPLGSPSVKQQPLTMITLSHDLEASNGAPKQ